MRKSRGTGTSGRKSAHGCPKGYKFSQAKQKCYMPKKGSKCPKGTKYIKSANSCLSKCSPGAYTRNKKFPYACRYYGYE